VYELKGYKAVKIFGLTLFTIQC